MHGVVFSGTECFNDSILCDRKLTQLISWTILQNHSELEIVIKGHICIEIPKLLAVACGNIGSNAIKYSSFFSKGVITDV